MPDALPTTEKELQARITKLAKQWGWMVNHTYRAQLADGTWRTTTTLPGWPDLELIHPGWGRIMWLELKGPKGRSDPDQKRVMAALQAVMRESNGNAHAYLVYPDDFPAISRLLTRQRP